jgi:aspartate/methionine/tyrosine aminotransferase
MRNFELETFFSTWEFTARHHMTASDMESMSLADLLSLADPHDSKELLELRLGYTQTWGADDLRKLIAGTYDSLGAKHVLCLAGAGEGIYAAMRVLLTPQDHAIVVVPNYQSAETIALEVCEVTGVALHEARNWQLDIAEVEAAIRPNTKLVSINFPHNPTGALMAHDDLAALVELCRKHDLYLFSDEVYRGVELDAADRMPQVADIYEKGISLNVMSKAYGMPGLRIGWVASKNTDVLQKIERYKHYLSICNSGPSERLAVIALEHRDTILDRNRAIVRENVVKLEALFNDFPGLFEWQRPKGGCVAFPKYTGPDGVEEFCKSLLKDSGVLLLPASVYKSELLDTPVDNFRIGFGRGAVFAEGLEAMRSHLETHYGEFRR